MPPTNILRLLSKLCHSFTMRAMRKRVRKKWKCLVLFTLVFGGCFIYWIYVRLVNPGISISAFDSEAAYDLIDGKFLESNVNVTRILLWTGMFGKYNMSAFEVDQNTFKNCPVECNVTFDKRLLSLSDAVIFHVRDIAKVGMPSVHAEGQMWVFYLQESSENTCLDLRPYKNIFNWTMTHRMDSDIYHPYSRILPINDLSVPDKSSGETQRYFQRYLNFGPERITKLLEKPKLIAWVVSNCYTHSNRESFIREIQKHVPVDIYGKCGDSKCPGTTSRDCYSVLAKTYKFYFAFENSLCVDYITEKFFDSLHYDIVPVVYGNGNYSLIAPPGSYIDARRFNSTEELAKYLLHLDSHPEDYLKFFSWKDKYRIFPSDAWCSLCLKLKSKIEPKLYGDIWSWWHKKPGSVGVPACLSYPDYPNESWFTKFRKKYFILQ